jgi:DNA-nicking Smr family endonuclease
VRGLSAEEAELWARVTATIRPLSRDPNDAGAPELGESITKPIAAPGAARKVERPKPAPERNRILHQATLDGSWDRKLSSGRLIPDRVLDLHGHSLDKAWLAIDGGLERALANGERVILLITGHERKGDPPLARGKIRAAVHDWLAASRHSSHIAAVRAAHRRHGGGGSLYIVLRRT